MTTTAAAPPRSVRRSVAPRSALHALTWLAWALAAAACLQLAPNPLAVAIVVLVAFLVVAVHGLDTPIARSFPLFVGLALVFSLVRIVLAAATTHGVGDVLFTTPSVTLPELLGGFTVGGTVELQVVLQAAAESFVVVGLVTVFGAWNAVVSHHEVLASLPRAFHEPGLVVTVGLAFVPSTIASIRATREADRARTGGVAVHRGRLVRTIVPVLESGMERAVALAESMDSRGFGRGEPTAAARVTAWCTLGALVAVASAFVALVGRATGVAAALGAAGVLLLLVAVVVASRASRRSRYRPRRLRPLDWAVGALVLLAPLVLAVLAVHGTPALMWTASPLAWPRFDPVLAAALLLLAVPAAVPPARAPVEPGDRAVPAEEPSVVALEVGA